MLMRGYGHAYAGLSIRAVKKGNCVLVMGLVDGVSFVDDFACLV